MSLDHLLEWRSLPLWAGAMVVASLSGLTYLVFSVPVQHAGGFGLRGYRRQRARRQLSFRLLEPLLRLTTAWVRLLPIDGLRRNVDLGLGRAGQWLGLSPDEFIALSLTCGALAAAFGSVIPGGAGPALVMGSFASTMPMVMMRQHAARRELLVERELPTVLELIALCVSAGMDLPGALDSVLDRDPELDSALRQELRQLKRELMLGSSRRRAFMAMSLRNPGDGVRDFCASVIQSEERGNPLRDVLGSQAKVLKLKRSFRAEVSGSRAAVKLNLPMGIMLFVMLLMLGAPLLLKFQEYGL